MGGPCRGVAGRVRVRLFASGVCFVMGRHVLGRDGSTNLCDVAFWLKTGPSGNLNIMSFGVVLSFAWQARCWLGCRHWMRA